MPACMVRSDRTSFNWTIPETDPKKFLICVCPTLSLFIHPHSASIRVMSRTRANLFVCSNDFLVQLCKQKMFHEQFCNIAF